MLDRKMIGLAVLALLSIALVAGCAEQAEKTVKAGDNVTVDYTGRLENGTVFDTSDAAIAQQAGIYNPARPYTPLSFVVGSGRLIDGFDQAVLGMKAGETKEFTVAPEQAYGQYNESLMEPVPLSVLERNNITPYVNQTLYFGTMAARVVGFLDNATVLMDFNHPLAGKTLRFTVTVREIRPA
jgi:peptidylprolyl isomerase